MYELDWVNAEFDAAPISDGRLISRLSKTTALLFQSPESSIPEACKGWAETKATYRLLDNDKITSDAILGGHIYQTTERMKKYNTVLCVQDTTSLDFTHHPNTEGLGLYCDFESKKGMLIHSTMAVTPNGVPLGLLSQDIWTRDPEEFGKKHKRRKLSTEEKESNKWLKALDASLSGVHRGIKTVTVCDRESDVYDFINKAVSLGKDFLIRVSQNRRIEEEYKTLIPQVENQPSAGEILTTVPRDAKNNRPSREVRLDIRHCPITVKPPLHRKAANTLPNLKLYLVLAQEVNPPEGVEPIYWLLLTTLPVTTLDEAVEKISWYKQRWKIERYHLTLKSGCKVEDLQLESFKRLQNAIAIYSIIAWRILWLTLESREHPDSPCDLILKKTSGKSFAV
jgi:hypothetical protein